MFFFICAALAVAKIGSSNFRKLGAGIACLIAGANAISTLSIVSPTLPDPYREDGAIGGYRAAALTLLPFVPEGSTLTAMQSGALGYYASDTIRVVNLDGVVNGDAFRAQEENRLGAYLSEIGADYFADWRLNVLYLARNSAEPDLVDRFEPVKAGPTQRRGRRMTLYRIDSGS